MSYLEYKSELNDIILTLTEIPRNQTSNHIDQVYYMEIRALEKENNFNIDWNSLDVKNLMKYGYRLAKT
jgi:hypothetical protein